MVEAMSRFFLALAVALAVLGGCSAPHYGSEQLRAEIGARYQLASGDRVRVMVFGQEGLTNSSSVDGAGNVSAPGRAWTRCARSDSRLRQGSSADNEGIRFDADSE